MAEMTRKAALAEARRRWGQRALIQSRPWSEEAVKGADGKVVRPVRWTRVPRLYRAVGQLLMGVAFAVEGQGQTWEQAFAAADRKTGRP